MKKILKKTVLVSILTLGSRILGLVRDAIIAMVFGTSGMTDAFFIAFRPMDLIRKLLSEGILGVSFIPVFSKVLEKEGKRGAAEMLLSFFCLLSAFAALIVSLSVIFAPLIISVIAPGFGPDSYQYHLSLIIFKIMLPYVWFVLVIALIMGVLNAFGNFGVPAAAPILFNITMISFSFFAANYFDPPVAALAFGVSVGGGLQIVLQIPFLMRLGLFRYLRMKIFNSASLRVLKLMLPAMIGTAAYQVNIMVASFFASRLDEGSVSFLYYADRLVQFPIALFAASTATVLLPDFSRMAAAGKLDRIGPMFSNGVIMVLFVTIPAMAGLMALDERIISFLFKRGAFDAGDVRVTSQCLFYLVTGLWAFTGSRLFVTLYFSLSNVRIPFLSGMISIVLNLLLCPVLIKFSGLQGLVLSVVISAAAGFLFLIFHLPGEVRIDTGRICVCTCRSFFLSVIMAILVRLTAAFLPEEGDVMILNGLGLCGCICLGMVFYFGTNYLAKAPEVNMLRQGFFRYKK